MKHWQEIIHQQTFRYIDQTEKQVIDGVPVTALESFAIDDALATSIGGGHSEPTIRLWVHPKTIVLGIPDARVPYIEQGVTMLHDKGYRVVVRNSGGLAVALDAGVLNFSLILPGNRDMSIYDCYEAMVRFVQAMLADKTQAIEAFEVEGSYCPGDYDLSIDGRKFAGISQRRIKNGIAVQIYLDVNGDTLDRARTIRDFYKTSIQGETTKFTYPIVRPETMASLSTLLQETMTVEDMKRRVLMALKDVSQSIATADFSPDELTTFQTRRQLMEKRNAFIENMKN